MPQTQRSCSEFSSEEQLEQKIEAAKQQMCSAPEREEKLRHWREMCRLIDLRTPARVRFMERVAGLA
jgi:hypothetical protein